MYVSRSQERRLLWREGRWTEQSLISNILWKTQSVIKKEFYKNPEGFHTKPGLLHPEISIQNPHSYTNPGLSIQNPEISIKNLAFYTKPGLLNKTQKIFKSMFCSHLGPLRAIGEWFFDRVTLWTPIGLISNFTEQSFKSKLRCNSRLRLESSLRLKSWPKFLSQDLLMWTVPVACLGVWRKVSKQLQDTVDQVIQVL